jgi:23S rRNA pseudouridine2605 synthase
VFAHLCLSVSRLIRVSFGPFQLCDLVPGAIEEVRTRTLREQLGPRLAASAGADFSAPLASSSKVEVGEQSEPREGTPARPPIASLRRSSAPEKAVEGRRCPPLQGEVSPRSPRRPSKTSKRRQEGFGPMGEPERARREKRRGRRRTGRPRRP